MYTSAISFLRDIIPHISVRDRMHYTSF